MTVRVDQVRKDNTQKAIRELASLYYNSNYVAFRDTEELTRMEGYTRHSSSELDAAIDTIRSRYGYYCAISYTYDLCDMFLLINVKEREYGHR